MKVRDCHVAREDKGHSAGELPPPTPTNPGAVAAANDRAAMRFLEFFSANIRNPHPRRPGQYSLQTSSKKLVVSA
jgi:hypothetical protein